MTLEQVLQQSIERLGSGFLSNEAQVKQSVILPILRALDWDDSNPREFVPELRVENDVTGRGFVDYALMGERSPLVFIEAKGPGKVTDGGEEQVFAYAFKRGTPFLVLTDGNVWAFYLTEPYGAFADRKFHHMELRHEDKITEYVQFLDEFLHKSQLVNNTMQIMDAARQLRDGNIQQEKARNTISNVWRNLLKTPDESLCSLIADGVESECGARPDLDDIETFLRGVPTSAAPAPIAATPVAPQPATQPLTIAASPISRTPKIVGFALDGKSVEPGNGNRTLAELIKEFQQRNPSFMERFSAQTTGRTRRLVATTRDGLYDEVHLRGYSLDLENGWWLGTNISSNIVRQRVATACEIMGVQFGSQLTLIER